MNAQDTSFLLLDPRIQKFIWSEGWPSLRKIQEVAIAPILAHKTDVILSAATASGKTEAAFFPALTYLCEHPNSLLLYISPLKALINDQHTRLDKICAPLKMSVSAWHGDIAAGKKAAFLKNPSGVLLITPESLEALFCNKGSLIAAIFANLKFIIIDEMHAFIGSERGKQLQSLMHRIDKSAKKEIPRIGLSATMGDLSLATQFLRPDTNNGILVFSPPSEGNGLKILIRSYENPANTPNANVDQKESITIADKKIAENLFQCLRGTHNLVFPNSRQKVEMYTHLLNQMCKSQNVISEFYPHHGSLSKSIREHTENTLKQKERPATAICTNTLELGIDIGSVKSIAQIGAPSSVAALRQRLGRSGRRAGESAILRGYSIEKIIDDKSGLSDNLRLKTVELIAMIDLLLESWFEPPITEGLHLSTLIQQILSTIAQKNGSSIGGLYNQLCQAPSPFSNISKEEFQTLLKSLGSHDLVMQEDSGLLLLSTIGERMLNNYDFYAAFSAENEFEVKGNEKSLGKLAITTPIKTGQLIIFAGESWIVDEIDTNKKMLYLLSSAKAGSLDFLGGGIQKHTKIRKKMRQLLESQDIPSFIDNTTLRFLNEGRSAYNTLRLHTDFLIDDTAKNKVLLLTWLGERSNQAIACMLLHHNIQSELHGPYLELSGDDININKVLSLLKKLGKGPSPNVEDLLKDFENLQPEKWDWALPDTLLKKSYASRNLNIEEAMAWLRCIAGSSQI